MLLEDLDLINRNEWLNGLDKAGLIRTINILCKALHESNEKIKTYEDPNDLTLMFMYCDEKAKDKIKELKEQNQKYKEVIDKVSYQIKLYLYHNWEKCTREFSVMTADFN